MTGIERLARSARGLAVAALAAAPLLAAPPAQARGGSGWFALGNELHQDGDYDQAIQAFEKAAERGYRPAVAWYNAACGWALKGDAGRAFAALEKAVDAGFDDPGLMRRDDDLDSIRSDPRFRDVERKARAAAAGNRDEADEATALLARLKAGDSRDGQAWFETAYALHSAGEYAAAASAWERAESLGHREGTASYNIACALALAGKEDEALARLGRAVEAGFADPEQIRRDSDLESLRDRPGFAAAIRAAEALELPPVDISSSRRKSWSDGLWRDTLARAERHLEGAPQSGHAWSNIGLARLRLDEPDKSVAAFQRALELGYRKGTTSYNVACAYARAGDAGRALEWLGKARDAGFEWAGQGKHDEDLDSLRRDPRFLELVRAGREAHEARERQERHEHERHRLDHQD